MISNLISILSISFYLNSMLSFFVGFWNLALCQFSYPTAFRLSQRRRIQINEFERHRVILCDHHNGVEACFMWSVTSFNYNDKKARDVDLTWWCHLSNVMSGSIFYKSMRQGITCSVSFCLLAFFFTFFCYPVLFCFYYFPSRGDTSVFLRMKEMESVWNCNGLSR